MTYERVRLLNSRKWSVQGPGDAQSSVVVNVRTFHCLILASSPCQDSSSHKAQRASMRIIVTAKFFLIVHARTLLQGNYPRIAHARTRLLGNYLQIAHTRARCLNCLPCLTLVSLTLSVLRRAVCIMRMGTLLFVIAEVSVDTDDSKWALCGFWDLALMLLSSMMSVGVHDGQRSSWLAGHRWWDVDDADTVVDTTLPMLRLLSVHW